MIRNLREHETKMKANLTEIYEAQQKHHATRLENFELIVTQLKSCVERGESILERNISAEILQTNQAIVGRCEELLNARKPEIDRPSHVNYILENKLNILNRIVVRVEIHVNGQPLTGSPWVVQVVSHQYQFAFQFGSTGKGQGEFDKPLDITVSEKTGTIAVADTENKRIQLFTSDGNFLREIKLNNKPTSLAFTGSGDVIVLMPNVKNQLSLFTEGGQFIKHINDEHLKSPCNISVGSDGRIITCNWEDKQIKVLSPDGNDFIQSFIAPDCDSDPWCAVYHQNTFFVSYPDAHCVKVFNNAGVYQYAIGCEGSGEGSGDGQLGSPTGIVVDRFDQLIVCDNENDRLQLFTVDGKFVTKITGQYSLSSYACHVAVNEKGNVFVADTDKRCIYVYH